MFQFGNFDGADRVGHVPPSTWQTEGLIGSIARLLSLTLAIPDHSTLSRRVETLEVPWSRASAGAEPIHLLVDITGLKLSGLVE